MNKKKKDTGEAADSDLPRVCQFCENASPLCDEDNVLCLRKGIVNKEYCCRRYAYDPLKRVPKPLPPFPKLSPDDLVL